LLLSRVGECVPREYIDNELWNGETAGNCSDVYVCYLRKKLEKIAGPGVLISVRGQGYMLKKP
jgi:DNA-binding response OmpR family regulator